VDQGSTRGFQGPQEVPDYTTHPVGFETPWKLAALHIRTVIIVKRGESSTNRKIQYLIYFISEVLSDSKTRYFHIMKSAYALLITSRKLSHYFQAHQIEVHTSSTLGEILNNREATGKITKWTIDLSMCDIIYKPRTAIKAQALSDFMAE
jgi:hypothetical protein